jgi:uncharacterized protein YegP (UPF0339 family)
MYHITKAGTNQFLVVLLNEKNREVLSTSELLNSKQKAFKNVAAQLSQTENLCYYVQDDTLKNPRVVNLTEKGIKVPTDHKPTARYVVKGRRGK